MRKNYLKLVSVLLFFVGFLFSCSVAVEESGGASGGSENIKSPINLTVEKVGEGQVELSWNALEGVSHYAVFYSDKANGEYRGAGLSETTKSTITWLLPGSTYYFQVKEAKDYNLYGRVSNVAKATTKPASLEAPVITTTSSTAFSTTFSWNAIKGANCYIIYRMDRFGGTLPHSIVVGSTIFDEIHREETHSTYRYKVAAFNEVSATSSELSVEKSVTLKTATLPKPQINFTANSYEISWELGTRAVGEILDLYQYSDSSATELIDMVSEVTSYHMDLGKDVEPGKTYYYRFKLYNKDSGEASPMSDIITVPIPQAELPSSPQKLKVDSNVDSSPQNPNVSDRKVTLSWAPVEGAENYYVYVYYPWKDSIEYLGSSPVAGYTHNFWGATLKDEQYYDVVVRAVKDSQKMAGPLSATLKVKVK